MPIGFTQFASSPARRHAAGTEVERLVRLPNGL
jgi:hypothetical protein